MAKIEFNCEVCGEMTTIKVGYHSLCHKHSANVSTAMKIAAMNKIKELINLGD